MRRGPTRFLPPLGWLLTLLLVALACTSSETRLVGKWRFEKFGNEAIDKLFSAAEKAELSSRSIEFFSDRTVTLSFLGAAGKWTLLDDGRVKIEISQFGTTRILMGRLDRDRFVLEMGDDPKHWTTWRRVSS